MKNKTLFAVLAVAFAAGALAFVFAYSTAPSPSPQLTFTAAAVTEDGRGVIVPFRMYLIQGSGRILVNVAGTTFTDDVENSLRKARLNAERVVGRSLSSVDLVLETAAEQRAVSGESAGTAFTMAIASLASNRPLREGTAVSAALAENGTLMEVDGVEEKILAALAVDKKVFVVAEGQEIRDEAALASLGVVVVRAQDVFEAARMLLS
ncbi:MAG: S16 family serine protease [Candidatus Micrarchaeota archaeon]